MIMSSYNTCILYIFYSLSWLNSMTSGSSGDRREDFRVCLSYCMTSCRYTETYPGKLPYYLSLFGWKCSDECKYSCMHEITHNSISRGLNVEQFYGKVSFFICSNYNHDLFLPFPFLYFKFYPKKPLKFIDFVVAFYSTWWNSRTSIHNILNW